MPSKWSKIPKIDDDIVLPTEEEMAALRQLAEALDCSMHYLIPGYVDEEMSETKFHDPLTPKLYKGHGRWFVKSPTQENSLEISEELGDLLFTAREEYLKLRTMEIGDGSRGRSKYASIDTSLLEKGEGSAQLDPLNNRATEIRQPGLTKTSKNPTLSPTLPIWRPDLEESEQKKRRR